MLRLLIERDEKENVKRGAFWAAIRGVSVPFGTPYTKLGDGFPVYNTEYRTVADLTHGIYGFELTTTPNFFWVEFSDFKPEKGQPALSLIPGALS